MSSASELPIVSFESAQAWEAWLAENYADLSGIWLRFFKKGSGKPTVTYAQALDAALCYGWIDGQAKKHDEVSYLQKFTPRRPRSVWSKRNTEHIERLMKEGRMKPSGLAQVEAAKADGRWSKAYDSPANMTVPDEFLQELAHNEKAQKFFATLNKTNTYAIAWRLQTAKRAETRERRMKAIIEMLERGEKFYG